MSLNKGFGQTVNSRENLTLHAYLTCIQCDPCSLIQYDSFHNSRMRTSILIDLEISTHRYDARMTTAPYMLLSIICLLCNFTII